MAGNSIGQLFRVSTFGESHGKALGCIIDGCPAGLSITEAEIQLDLDRRRPGVSKYTTTRREADQVTILSGVFEGKTTGTPIALLIENTDQRSNDYSEIKDLFRPGHADYTYHKKYGFRDHRGGGRSSARETAMRVAAGAIAKKYLAEHYNIKINAYLSQMGDIEINEFDLDEISKNEFFCPDKTIISDLDDLIRNLKKQGNSIGAKVSMIAQNIPAGIGEPVFDRLDAELAYALMSINAAKGIEIGDGFNSIKQKGNEHRDEISPQGFLSNHAGGILGGISTGQDVIAHVAFKPTSSIAISGNTIDKYGNPAQIITKGRHDPCVGIRAVPIVEAMTAIVIMDHIMRQRAQNPDRI